MIDALIRQNRPAEILLIDDNGGDVILTRKAFCGGKVANTITSASTGEEALAILEERGGNTQPPFPDLILMDLNLPCMHGTEILHAIKSDKKLRHIPVVILTSSRAEEDVAKTYEMHANSYVVKPLDLEKFKEIAAAIEGFWFSAAVMPDEHSVRQKW